MTDTIAHRVWYDDLGFCGCGNPEIVLARIRDYLRATQDLRETEHAEDDAYPLGKPTPRVAAAHDKQDSVLGADQASSLVLLYALTKADLIEHGGSVYGSWPTPKGEELLAYLEATAEDEWLLDD